MDSIKIEPMSEVDDQYEFQFLGEEDPDSLILSPVSLEYPKQETSLRTKSRNTRVQHYRAAWEKNPMFFGWLKPGRNSRKAVCTVCLSEMTADISVLKYHAQCSKHLVKMNELVSGSNQTSFHQFITPFVAAEYEPEIVKKGYYNPNWEKDHKYGSWIQAGSTERHAYCRLCKVQMSADTGSLRRHLATYSHMRAADFDDQLHTITSLVRDKNIVSESIALATTVEYDQENTVMVHEINNKEVPHNTDPVPSTCSFPSGSGTSHRDMREEPLEKLSFLIGKFLLKGHKMLNGACDKCGCVLLQDRKKTVHCVGCQYGLMEEINNPSGEAKVKKPSRATSSKSYNSRGDSHPRLSVNESYSEHIAAAASVTCRAAGSDSLPIEEVLIKEEIDDELTEIVINEDSGMEDVVVRRVEQPSSAGCDVAGVDLSSEVSSLVSTLRGRLVSLTDQLDQGQQEDDNATDTCLLHLDNTVTALAKLKRL